MSELPITPETRLQALLKAYPQLEEALIEISPSFAKLKNPVLRKTVAKVATLRQVATVGNIPVATLINSLREKVGIQQTFHSDDGEEKKISPPTWFDPDKISKSLDARPLIESGASPLDPVFSELKHLETGQLLELVTPFLPSPLIDKVKDRGFHVWTKEEKKDLFKTYITNI